MKNKSTNFDSMTWSEFDQYKDDIPFLVLVTGSIEQHGPHLPLGADTMVAKKIAFETCAKFNAIQLPEIPVGVNFAFSNWPGTVNISSEIYIKMIIDICTTASKWCKRIMIINGHDENHAPLLIAARDLIAKLNIEIVLFEWAILVRPELQKICESKNEMHAGEGLTSLFLYWFPNDVRIDYISDGKSGSKGLFADDIHITASADFPVILNKDNQANGIWGNPILSTPEKGRLIAESLINKITQLVQELGWGN